MQSDYARTQDEILKIQENIMNGYNAPPEDQTENLTLTPTHVTSNGILQNTLNNKYSHGKGPDEIGVCRYPYVNKIYYTNKKLYNNDILIEEENNNGLKMIDTVELVIDQLTYFQNSYNSNVSNEIKIGEISLDKQSIEFEIKGIEKISTLPSITKPEMVINKQLKVYISFEHFFLDYNYPFATKLWEGQNFEYTKDYFQQFLSHDENQNTIKVYKSEELSIWGVNIYTDDSNPLGILRHCAVYEKVEENGKIIGAEGANGLTNQGELCLKGYYGWDFIHDTKILTPRLKTPMIRRERGGKLEAVSWDEAIEFASSKLLAIKEKYGAKAIMTTGSSRGPGNEANFVMQKFARAVIGNNNIDCCARV